MRDAAKAARLRRLTTVVELPVMVWGVTAWGEAVWGEKRIGATFEDAKGGKFDRDYVDAQTLVAAQRLGIPLVTNDRHLMKKARRNGVQVMSSAEVLAAVDLTTQPATRRQPQRFDRSKRRPSSAP